MKGADLFAKNVGLFNAIRLVENQSNTAQSETMHPPWTHPYTTLDLAQRCDAQERKYFETWLEIPKAKPALCYREDSAKVMRIIRIRVDYELEHNLDQLPESLS